MKSASRYPNIAYIREQISIVSVARALGLHVDGYRARCWRPENHRNGDRTPSVGLNRKTNHGRCFVCDPHSWSNIDLVMLCRGCDMLGAVFWIAERFSVPDLPKGIHLRKREEWSARFMASRDDSLVGLLVRSGLWAQLTPSEAKILQVFVTFRDVDTACCEVSYRGILRYSGVGSHATVVNAVRHFEQIGFLKVIRGAESRVNRRVNRYMLNMDDPDFQSLMSAIYQRQREEIETERALREKQRAERRSRAPV
jgi:hypothetical protein